MVRLGRQEFVSYSRGIEKEWLVTNGLGGFASSTVIGANTRRYHGLLVAALNPPLDRRLLLTKIEEEVWVGGRAYKLSTNQYSSAVYPEGYLFIQEFRLEPFPTWIFNVGGSLIEKQISMVYGENTTMVTYKIIYSANPVVIRLIPLVNCRDYHHLTRESSWIFDQLILCGKSGVELSIEAYPGAPILKLAVSGPVHYVKSGIWHRCMEYPVEKRRGLDYIEDHFNPGFFESTLNLGAAVGLVATTAATYQSDINTARKRELERLDKLSRLAALPDEFSRELAIAADDFIVIRKTTGTRSIIAGYPWFTDWGRDTMISLPGLTLVTKRYDDAKEILWTFSRYVSHGLIPNRFPDEGETPDYNTVDASLWFFYAVHKYLEYSKDVKFIQKEIYPIMRDMIDHYRRGTLYNIVMESDGLVTSGSHGVQLTWMDAKAGDWVVTPRHGKAVEINALWYNALKVMSMLSTEFGFPDEYGPLADKVKESFEREFWNPSEGCLFDIVGALRDSKVRPNQIFAVSLPFQVLNDEKASLVTEKVLKELYIGVGLRSLSPKDGAYIGTYGGSQYQRDAAYHQGTAWSWLIGPLITAFVRVNNYSEESRKIADYLISPIKAHLRDACLGNISEIFDGNPPHKPRGCFAQAWGVGEVLRAYVEDVLNIKP